MKISEVSEKFGITIQTLRYYERIGIIPKVNRNSSGIRDYDKRDLNWIHYIQALRAAGASIESIKQYVSLVELGPTTRECRKEILLEQKDELIKKREEINEALFRMNRKLDEYHSYVIELEKNTKNERNEK